MNTPGKIKSIIVAMIITATLSAQNQPTFYLRGLLEMWKKNSANTTSNRIQRYNELIPESIRGNVVYSLSVASMWYYTKLPSNYNSFIDDSYLDLCERVDQTGIPFVVNVAEVGNYPKPLPSSSSSFNISDGGYYVTPAQVEKIFKNTTHCKGIESGENFWTYNPTTVKMVLDLLRVCKTYKKTYILGEGGWGYSTFVRFFNENYLILKNEDLGKYLVPVFKNTKPYGALVTQSSIMGAWATGLVSDYGTWNDEWAWTYSSFGDANQFPDYDKSDNNYLKVPFTHLLKSWLLTIAMGGKANFMETPLFGRDATPYANMTPYWEPFIKGLADHNIMPSKSAVLAKVKAIANPYGTYSFTDRASATYNPTNLISYQTYEVPYNPTSLSTHVDPYGRLFKNTYEFWNKPEYTGTGTVTDRFFPNVKAETGRNYLQNSVLREVFPNNPRYLIIPLLPHPNAESSVPGGIETVALNTLKSDAAVKTKFESLYPVTSNDNGAWAREIDNSFFVINSHENADIDQDFTFSLGKSTILSLSGSMPFQNILFGKREGTDNYWFQSNGYAVANGTSWGQKFSCPIKKTVLKFKCRFEPELEVEDNKRSYISKSWNPTSGIFQLIINHASGAVNFRVVDRRASQKIKFDALDEKIYAESDFTLTASSNSHLAVTYTSSNIDVAKVYGGKFVKITGVGTTTITAYQSGNESYKSAQPVKRVLTVNETRARQTNDIPGVIQAENFDLGAAGYAYSDKSTGNSGESYRAGSVDIAPCDDVYGGYHIQSTQAGEWVLFTVNVESAGRYKLSVRLRSGDDGSIFHLGFDGVNRTGDISPPNKGWHTWFDQVDYISLPAGVQKMKLYVDAGKMHFNKLTFTYLGQSADSDKSTMSGFGNIVSFQSDNLPALTTTNSGIRIAPNPVVGNRFEVKTVLPAKSDVEISVLDLKGNVICTQNMNKQAAGNVSLSVSIPKLVSGMYLLQFKSADEVKLAKFIVK